MDSRGILKKLGIVLFPKNTINIKTTHTTQHNKILENNFFVALISRRNKTINKPKNPSKKKLNKRSESEDPLTMSFTKTTSKNQTI